MEKSQRRFSKKSEDEFSDEFALEIFLGIDQLVQGQKFWVSSESFQGEQRDENGKSLEVNYY